MREGFGERVEQIFERSFPRQKRTKFVLEKLIKFELVFKFIVLRFACTASSLRLGMPALKFENLSLFSLVRFLAKTHGVGLLYKQNTSFTMSNSIA